jgi:hypothetical protein
MSIIKKMRKQYAVYWPPLGPNQSGMQTYGEPVEIRCRWEDDDFAFVDSKGTTVASTTSVFPDRILEVGGILWKGRLLDVPSQSDPLSNENSDEIIKFGELPNLRAKEFLWKATLGKEALSLIKKA